ncbi:MAG TPA: hypothetical protein PKA55_10920 [Rhodoblastus sp.]|nr:hypothetical protein [Rhodoblastus sp.]
MRALRTSFVLFALVAATPALAANVNPPETKDAAPEARENVQDKNKDGVVTPPANVDPRMKTDPPHDSSVRTPVIPPPTEKDGKKIEPK